MSADRGNKNFTMWHYLFSYARYSNKDQRLSLLGALILPLEAIPQAVGAIPLRLGVFLGVLGWQGLFPWHLELPPWRWGLTDRYWGLPPGRQGLSLGHQRLTPVFLTLNSHHTGKCHRKKLLAAFTIGQMENGTENNGLQHLKQGKSRTQILSTRSAEAEAYPRSKRTLA